MVLLHIRRSQDTSCALANGAHLCTPTVHPWDIGGPRRAGMRTAWLIRRGQTYPGYFLAPDHSVAALTELASIIA